MATPGVLPPHGRQPAAWVAFLLVAVLATTRCSAQGVQVFVSCGPDSDFGECYSLSVQASSRLLLSREAPLTWQIYSATYNVSDTNDFGIRGLDTRQRVWAGAPLTPRFLASVNQTFEMLDITPVATGAPLSYNIFRVEGAMASLTLTDVTVNGHAGRSLVYGWEAATVDVSNVDVLDGLDCAYGCFVFCAGCEHVVIQSVFLASVEASGTGAVVYAEACETVTLTNVTIEEGRSHVEVGNVLYAVDVESIAIDSVSLDGEGGKGGIGGSVVEVRDGRDVGDSMTWEGCYVDNFGSLVPWVRDGDAGLLCAAQDGIFSQFCDVGMYEQDGICVACSVCEWPSVVLEQCAGTKDAVCSACVIGTNQQLLNPFTCELECVDGTYDVNGEGHGESNALDCQPCGGCSFPQVALQGCSLDADTVCSTCTASASQQIVDAYTCSLDCIAGTYDANGLGIGGASELDCQPCSSCTHPQTTLNACNSTSDTQCSACTIGSGEQLVDAYACTVECVDGTYDVNGNGTGSSGSLNCVACDSCSFPHVVLQDCTIASNVVCSACVVGTNEETANAYTCAVTCVDGTYDANGMGSGPAGTLDCQPCSSCTHPQTTVNACTVATNTLCSTCAIGADEQLINAYACTVECVDGTYDINGAGSGPSGSLACTECGVCDPPQVVVEECSIDSNVECSEPCVVAPNEQVINVTTCEVQCANGYYDLGGMAVGFNTTLSCTQCSVCDWPNVVIDACTLAADTTCTECAPAGTEIVVDPVTCEAICATGMYDASGAGTSIAGSLNCTNCSDCVSTDPSNVTFVDVACQLTADTVCGSCHVPDGATLVDFTSCMWECQPEHHLNADASGCVPCSSCGDYEYATQECTGAQDAVCVSCSGWDTRFMNVTTLPVDCAAACVSPFTFDPDRMACSHPEDGTAPERAAVTPGSMVSLYPAGYTDGMYYLTFGQRIVRYFVDVDGQEATGSPDGGAWALVVNLACGGATYSPQPANDQYCIGTGLTDLSCSTSSNVGPNYETELGCVRLSNDAVNPATYTKFAMAIRYEGVWAYEQVSTHGASLSGDSGASFTVADGFKWHSSVVSVGAYRTSHYACGVSVSHATHDHWDIGICLNNGVSDASSVNSGTVLGLSSWGTVTCHQGPATTDEEQGDFVSVWLQ